ncbi:MAG: NAD(P)/FAD-dependent oxidoreductase [Hyalangium sp.]|uniref:NAD(P)/FAD-dependent oxidoreductase n=1 Tax=Hyalangium sp. TaxID=2028555 RepID=UPI00389A1518
MPRTDQKPLINLSPGRKVFFTLALLLTLFLFFSALFFSVFLTSWHLSLGVALIWGGMLAEVRAHNPLAFWLLFAGHALSLGLALALASHLFRKVAIPRGARVALLAVTAGLGLLDLACWLLLHTLSSAPTLLGYAVAAESLWLLFIAGRPLKEMWLYTHWRGRPGRPVRVVIVGGGFAGLYAALGLDRALGYHKGLEIVLIDKKNYFLFPPLLPSVAAGAIETRQVTYPFRRIFEASNVIFKKEWVRSIDTERKVIHALADVDAASQAGASRAVTSETLYDFLVLAPGSETQTFGTRGVVQHAYFMRELGDAAAVRNQIIDCFEHAAREDASLRRREMLRFVVVGGGPTGVELASEIRDLCGHILLRRYPEIDPSEVEVVLVQSASDILPSWNPFIVQRASRQLEHLGIRLLKGRRVTAVEPSSVTLDDGTRLETRTCVWCAGVKPSALLKASGLPLHGSGRVTIGPDLRVPGYEDVFVLGDAALCEREGRPLPPLGQVAFQQGSHTARNIVRLLKGRQPRPFRYFNYGSLVSVGEHFAAVDLMGVRMAGFLAWIIWRTLYLVKLVGFSNKLRVVIDWTLDLLVERSISQIHATRQNLALEELAEAEAAESKQPAA